MEQVGKAGCVEQVGKAGWVMAVWEGPGKAGWVEQAGLGGAGWVEQVGGAGGCSLAPACLLPLGSPQHELADEGVQGEPVHALANGQHEDGGAAVQAVPRTHQPAGCCEGQDQGGHEPRLGLSSHAASSFGTV
ncbi:hypothetical protein HaLaN_13289 [Haematococcus lacustris]|uniref:Uncharacterized protein n=1 Tax=Haematococcus lacustris TaxID=44745 RepID=A0A699ZD38_HAELA|nr:hypothetical protein HaLaN_13289 [Haematococcus lacustris]